MNIGCDILSPDSDALDQYDLIVIPALYAASDDTLDRLNRYVENGGHVVYTFKSGFANEHIKVRTNVQPGRIDEVCGIRYSQFIQPDKVILKGDPFGVGAEHNTVEVWMELLTRRLRKRLLGTSTRTGGLMQPLPRIVTAKASRRISAACRALKSWRKYWNVPARQQDYGASSKIVATH
ncbi:Beta-galactosidase trimerisation domain-containing protein [Paenibacillus endophyticus]